jgi:nucleotide-binding universal stress UspA family protein
MKIEKIGVGIDMSEQSIAALDQAMVVARHFGASIVLITAGDVHESGAHAHGPSAAAIEYYENILEERQRRVRTELQELHERYSGQGVDMSQTLVHGFADIAIADAAAEMGLDLLVLGTHGRTGLSRFFLGSVAERVVRLATCDVLIARGQIRTLDNILVPTDFSPHAERAIEVAVALAAPGATLTLLHCTGIDNERDAKLPAHLAESVETAVQARADKLAEHYADEDLIIKTVVIAGAPAGEIRRIAEDEGADLICMGSHGRRGARRLILGSVAEVTVRHAPCSVYVAHNFDPSSD